MEVSDIINYLRDKEFAEDELVGLLNQLVREKKEMAANRAIRQFNEARGRFRAKREERLRREYKDRIGYEIANDRAVKKNERAQAMYKKNRAAKKKEQAVKKQTKP